MGQSQTKQVKKPTRIKDGKIRLALVGNCGAGKSSFVNAIRGICDDDEAAAEVGVVATTTKRTEYSYFGNSMITFVDLPGLGTPTYPDVQTFCKNFYFEEYDFFLIFFSLFFTLNDLQLVHKVKSLGKSFFVIRTKMDVDMSREKVRCVRRSSTELREEVTRNLKQCISTEKDIFLISNYDKHIWDFDRLVMALNDIHVLHSPKPDRFTSPSSGIKEAPTQNTKKTEEKTVDLTEEYLADVRKYIMENGVAGIEDFLRKKLDELEGVDLRIGVTGNAGTGKSAFINAIRGIDDDDDDNNPAQVGFTETTLEPQEYEYCHNGSTMYLVDLPGIGTPTFPDPETYYSKVDFESYDTFLIFSSSRFTENDLVLASKVKTLGKSFFLIRTKIDVDFMGKKGKKVVCEKTALQTMRQNLMGHVKGLISSEKEIFLISSYDKDKWDFDRLVEAISNALPIVKKAAFTLCLGNLTRDCMKRKTQVLKAQAVTVAALSASFDAIPIPSWSADYYTLISSTIKGYYNQFGLQDITPDEFEKFNEYKALQVYKFQSREELVWSLISEECGTRTVIDVSKCVPILGTIIAGSSSFALTLRYLRRCVSEMEEVALAVWDEAAKQSALTNDKTG